MENFNNPKEVLPEINSEIKKKNLFFFRHWAGKLFFILIILSLALVGSVYAYVHSYTGKVLPNIVIGSAPIGGMDKEALRSFLNKMNDKLANDGLTFIYEIGGEQKKLIIYPLAEVDKGSVDLVRLDTEAEVVRLLNYGKDGNFLTNAGKILSLQLSPEPLALKNIVVDGEQLTVKLKQTLSGLEPQPVNANVQVLAVSPLTYKITSSSPGVVFAYNQVESQVKKNWSNLQNQPIIIGRQEQAPQVLESAVAGIVNRLPQVFAPGEIVLNYIEPQTGRVFSWHLDVNKIKNWLEVQPVPGDGWAYGLNADMVKDYLRANVSARIDVPARNAKFKMDEANGRVIEFQASRPGIALNLTDSYNQINSAILDRTWHDEGLIKSLTLSIKKTEPAVKTGDVNNLGIKEILGVGVSDYSNSPSNRQKNIANAVKKLNGLLIKPGEIFSTLKYTAPFTLEGGYFPELVIKGDKLKPEVGGGLCQIGTTLFRMSMNSAMKIMERQNHSLVVSHYNDPVNNLPGTDATVYDPAPDFKFKNDTESYVLIQTFMDKKNQDLVFTLWGTADGRQGSYTHPVVKQWLPSGEPKNIETTDLAPGKKECQNAFKGADAIFTYTRILSDSTKEDKVFESHYRPLPKICLIGVAASSTSSGIGGGSTPSSTPAADLLVAQ